MSALVCGGKIGSIKEYECIGSADFGPHKPQNIVEVFAQMQMQWSASSSRPEPGSTLEAHAALDASGSLSEAVGVVTPPTTQFSFGVTTTTENRRK